jgi:hypothetical protein
MTTFFLTAALGIREDYQGFVIVTESGEGGRLNFASGLHLVKKMLKWKP